MYYHLYYHVLPHLYYQTSYQTYTKQATKHTPKFGFTPFAHFLQDYKRERAKNFLRRQNYIHIYTQNTTVKLSHLKQIIKEEFLKEYGKETNKPSDREFEQAINDVEVIIPLISHRILHDKNIEHNEENIAKLNKIILQKVKEGNDEILDEMWELAGSAIMKNAINIITFYTKTNLQENIQKIREIKVNKMGNLTIDPQIQQDMDGNPGSNLERKYRRSLLRFKRLYGEMRNLGSPRPISFEIGIARNYSWLPEIFIGQWVANDGFKSEDELILMTKQGSKELAIMGGGNSFYAVANTIDGENIIEEYGEEGEYSEDEMVKIFIAWSKLP